MQKLTKFIMKARQLKVAPQENCRARINPLCNDKPKLSQKNLFTEQNLKVANESSLIDIKTDNATLKPSFK